MHLYTKLQRTVDQDLHAEFQNSSGLVKSKKTPKKQKNSSNIMGI